MTPLETLEFDYKQKGYLDPEKLFKVLREQETELIRLRLAKPSTMPSVPYTNPEGH